MGFFARATFSFLCVAASALADLRVQAPLTFHPTATASEEAANLMDFLVIVGDVSADSARILYEPTSTAPNDAGIQIELAAASDDGSFIPVTQVEHAHTQAWPYAHEFATLSPNVEHRVVFRFAGEAVAEAWFRTAPASTDAVDVRVLSVSCDRFSQDADDTHWAALADDMSSDPTYFGIVHTGDQIYADDLVDFAVARALTAAPLSFDETLDAFRKLYRRCFGRPMLQHVLRRGAHWMLMDDHDIINNWSYQHAASATHEVLVRAGLRAFYEYQYQLLRDVDLAAMAFSSSNNWTSLYQPAHMHRRVGNLSLLLMDTRLDRGLRTSAAAPTLMSDEQLAFVQQTLDSAVPTDRIVVFTPLPLFFHTKYSAAFADVADGEMYPGIEAFRPFFRQLWPHLRRADLLVGGDLHMTAATRVCGHVGEGDPWRCVDQLITSGMTQQSTTMNQLKLIAFHFTISQILQPFHWVYSAVAPATRTEFAMLSRDVFYGKNYGYIALTKNQTLSFGSVVQPYGTLSATLIQLVSDALTWAAQHGVLSSGIFVGSCVVYFRISTVSATGTTNLAPFSFFTVVSSDPPIVSYTQIFPTPGTDKDTLTNLKATKECVVNFVSAALVDVMNATSAPFPHGVSEIDALGIATIASQKVQVPGVAASPIRMECTLRDVLEIGNGKVVLLEVVHFEVDEALLTERGQIDSNCVSAVGRMSRNDYVATRDLFEIVRPTL
uniref:Secreted protein n=1 Tax=Achlya hypogyna TaxID=1202772 RepID=A0A0A7CMS7_ACHHY|nr:secreted protein [Achlya hypogyna]